MFGLRRIINAIKIQSKKSQDNKSDNTQGKLSRSLPKNVRAIREIMSDSTDLIIRPLNIGGRKPVKGVLIFIDGLVNAKTINENIIKPLQYDSRIANADEILTGNAEEFMTRMLTVGEVKDADNLSGVIDGCLQGDSALIIDGFCKAFIINTKGWDMRSISEPMTEAVVRGPREGFTENMRTNTALLRRKIKSPDLTFEVMKIGRRTRTNVCIVYIKSIADSKLIEEVKRRLSVIDTDAILESGYIEQFIEDSPFSLFATVAYSEKPDVVAAKLLEGRAGIIVDGTPFVLTVHMLFLESFQTAEDYYIRTYAASMLRFIRFMAFSISLLAPGFYVALTTYHQELIPTPLLISMTSASEGVPFPAVMEVGTMLIVFEILREAGLRMPKPIGQAISIVGALVVGEAAVTAGLISAPIVIVIAVTAVSSFVVPNQYDASSILRIIYLISAAVLGGFGLALGLLGTLIYLSSLESFSTPYFSPFSPTHAKDLKDSAIRLPLWTMITRP
ncbi:MAG TPA: spore germination protein, partial [Clostridia bacterium]|nr:spore germination protein [Clostridia bacterium]